MQQIPVLSECDGSILEDEKARNECSNSALLRFIYKHLKYPAIVRELGVEGKVVVEFLIVKKGQVGSVKILRDVGANCGNALVKVLEKMPKWQAGVRHDRKVIVVFRIPVKFQLE